MLSPPPLLSLLEQAVVRASAPMRHAANRGLRIKEVLLAIMVGVLEYQAGSRGRPREGSRVAG